MISFKYEGATTLDMREHLIGELGDVTYQKFLVYLMGPYTSFPIDNVLSNYHDADEVSPPSGQQLSEATNGMLDLLRHVQGTLRVEPGVNAFLAVDANISLEEMDAATQSIRLARASNVVVFVLPLRGDNLGVGIEVGAVLEDSCLDRDRIIVIYEDDVTSAMLESVTQRWDVRIISFRDESELLEKIRRFIANIMVREKFGYLPRKGQ